MRQLRLGSFFVLLAFLALGGIASQAAPASARATLRFTEMAADVVGRLNNPKPNGERDAHFTAKRINPGEKKWLSIKATTPRTFELYASEIGTFAPGQVYVYAPLAPRAAPVRLELTANDPTPAGQPSLFRSGER